MVLLILGIVLLALYVSAGIFLHAKNKDNKFMWVDIGVGCGFAVLCVILSCMTVVPEEHVGVVTKFGEVQNETLASGVHFKAPWEKVHDVDIRVTEAKESVRCYSSDIKDVSASVTVIYQIDADKVTESYAKNGKGYYDNVIMPIVKNKVVNIISTHTADELVSDNYALVNGMLEPYGEIFNDNGIIIVSIGVEFGFTEETVESNGNIDDTNAEQGEGEIIESSGEIDEEVETVESDGNVVGSDGEIENQEEAVPSSGEVVPSSGEVPSSGANLEI